MNLNIFITSGLFEASTNLFQQLGIKLNSNTAEALPTKDLLKNFYKDNEVFNSIKSTYFIGIIDDSVFQTTGMFNANYSIKEALQQSNKSYDGLMFFALELTKKPTRTEISEITRAFNRISQKMPVALVLKYSIENEAVISIAISERFKYLQNWRQGEKAGKVIILRDIFTSNTHAGHLRILLDLVKPAGVTNYSQLHAHWLEVLDVNILNKKFFLELANWYFWAMDKVQFPDDIEKKKDVRNATNLIRLITRVIFIWFIKEKHLVPDSLFNKEYIGKILKDFNKNKKSVNYYQAILQNLFFGTLNQKMDERDFAEDHNRINKLDQGIKNKYRYPDKFNITKKEIINLFKDIPFLNGGLFDCLDKFDEEKLEKGKKEQIFVDGFTRLDGKQTIIPDYLFFGEEVEVDLTEYYDPEAKKAITKKVKGLFHILNSFKFTVAENTPIEEEIALDPELLGKVFENLLASYNPETKTTARKQTGSFYTPREIVNYMVDESLIEYLKSVVSIPAQEKSTLSIPAQEKSTLSIPAQENDDFFNPNNEIQIHTGNLPHWQQEKVWYFVTFRLADSIPAEVAEKIKAEREIWLKRNKKNEKGEYTIEQKKEYYRLFSERTETLLNNGRGSCVLKNPEISKIVADALNYFNNQRYLLNEWVIMPNHVHILVKPLEGYTLHDITHSWKSYTANEINKITGNRGQLWMHESYDHIVRNEKALEAIRNYIRQNPVKAKLKDGEYLISNISMEDFDSPTESKDAFETFFETMDARLRNLFSYDDEDNPFNSKETDGLIEAINNAKILDPACGSGAFPMGVLHKMVHLLKKLDPQNIKWKAQQKEKIIGNQIKELEKDKETIAGLSDKAVREKAIKAVDERLKEIDEIFESKNNFDDYTRKLYLIENCIYGIDIQPIAVQISKLRFFISLIIDQKVHKVHPSSLMDDIKPKENLGIRPLPNLETKFVAANTLICLEIPTTDLFSENNPIKILQDQLKATRHEYFNAKTRKDKLRLQQQDKELRKKIAAQISDTLIIKKEEEIKNLEKELAEAKKELVKIENEPDQKETIESTNIFGETETTIIDKKKEKLKTQKSTISSIEKQINSLKASDNKGAIQKVAQQISSFDPYDQNHFANWFEPEWMFGNEVKDGFDIVIGNPPYVSAPSMVNNYPELRQMIIDSNKYKSLYQKWDLYIPFMELGLQLLTKNGVFSMIVPYPLTNQNYGLKLREMIINDYCLKEIVDLNGTKVFENATVSNCIPFISKADPWKSCYVSNVNQSGKIERVFIQSKNDLIQDNNTLVWNLSSEKRDTTKHSKCNVLGDYCYISVGMVLNSDEKTAKGEFSKDDLISDTYDKIHCRKYIEAKDIERYRVGNERYLEYNTKRCPGKLRRPTFRELYEKPKLMFNRLGNLMVILDDVVKYLHSDSMFSAVLWHDLDGVENKSISSSVKRYSNLSRREMVELSKDIDLRYLLGVLNSKYASVLLTNLRAGDYHIYPEHIRNIPIPYVTANQQKPIISLVEQVISAKKSDSLTDTSKLEKQIDELVYKLYDLTEEEIAIIENKE